MKVKQLIKKLQKVNPEALVVLSSDSEGNNFSILCDVIDSNESFSPSTNNFYDDGSELEIPKDAKLAVILFP